MWSGGIDIQGLFGVVGQSEGFELHGELTYTRVAETFGAVTALMHLMRRPPAAELFAGQRKLAHQLLSRRLIWVAPCIQAKRLHRVPGLYLPVEEEQSRFLREQHPPSVGTLPCWEALEICEKSPC